MNEENVFRRVLSEMLFLGLGGGGGGGVLHCCCNETNSVDVAFKTCKYLKCIWRLQMERNDSRMDERTSEREIDSERGWLFHGAVASRFTNQIIWPS